MLTWNNHFPAGMLSKKKKFEKKNKNQQHPVVIVCMINTLGLSSLILYYYISTYCWVRVFWHRRKQKMKELWIKNLVLVHANCDADFKRNKGMYKQGWLPRAFANTLWMDSRYHVFHYCILIIEVCRRCKKNPKVLYYLNLSFTWSFHCDSFIYKKTKLWYIHIHLSWYEMEKNVFAEALHLCLWEQRYEKLLLENGRKICEARSFPLDKVTWIEGQMTYRKKKKKNFFVYLETSFFLHIIPFYSCILVRW